MKKPEMSIIGVMIANLVSRYLARNRKRAEYIVAQTFPGYSLKKTRADKGKKKTPKGETKNA